MATLSLSPEARAKRAQSVTEPAQSKRKQKAAAKQVKAEDHDRYHHEEAMRKKAMAYEWLRSFLPNLFLEQYWPVEVGLDKRIKDLAPHAISKAGIRRCLNDIFRSDSYVAARDKAMSSGTQRHSLEEIANG